VSKNKTAKRGIIIFIGLILTEFLKKIKKRSEKPDVFASLIFKLPAIKQTGKKVCVPAN
jgi:hypothetical protein